MNTPTGKVLPILRLLENSDLSERRIAELVDVAPTTVSRYRRIQHEKGYKLADLEHLSPRELRRRFGHARRWRVSQGIPHWPEVYRRMCRPGASLLSIWTEYHDDQPEGYSYPRFISYYKDWKYRLNVLHRQQQRAGDAVFVGFGDARIPWTDPSDGKVRGADIYFAVLGASGYSYISAGEPESKEQWFDFNVRMFEFFGGVPTKIERAYIEGGFDLELTFNEDYERLTIHYCTHLAQAFPYGLRLPLGARLVSRWMVSQLRKCRFSSIDEINQAIQPLLVRLNHKPFKRLPGCRASWFQEVERSALRPLPTQPYLNLGDHHAQH